MERFYRIVDGPRSIIEFKSSVVRGETTFMCRETIETIEGKKVRTPKITKTVNITKFSMGTWTKYTIHFIGKLKRGISHCYGRFDIRGHTGAIEFDSERKWDWKGPLSFRKERVESPKKN